MSIRGVVLGDPDARSTFDAEVQQLESMVEVHVQLLTVGGTAGLDLELLFLNLEANQAGLDLGASFDDPVVPHIVRYAQRVRRRLMLARWC